MHIKILKNKLQKIKKTPKKHFLANFGQKSEFEKKKKSPRNLCKIH